MNLPKELDPLKACSAGQIFAGELPASAFTHITGFERVHYCFRCFMSERNEPMIELKLQTTLELLCQRCNKPMDYRLDETMMLDEEAAFEPLKVVEDELILALPMIPMHREKDCSFAEDQAYYAAQKEKDVHQPFALLRKVMHAKE